MRLAPGARLGPYEIVAEIGAGGMGEVYRARDTRLNRTVAIKTLSPAMAADPKFQERFHREARTISRLEHPHVCPLYDVGHEDGTDYLVMQYLEGETLAARLIRSSLPLPQTLQIAIEIASALNAAHRRGVAHRDLKPANVMLTPSGAKLLDFGIATAVTEPFGAVTTMSTPVTAGGHLHGTLHYMAPEQLEGHEADTRADIFALGAVIFEMLTGRRAFDGSSSAGVIAAVLTYQPPPVSSVQPVSPPALDYLVQRCLAKDPQERWQTVHDVRLQLEWLASKEASGEETAARRVARGPGLLWLVVMAAMVTITALATWRLTARPPAQQSLMRFEVSPPSGSSFYALQMDLSPDGRHLAIPLTMETRRTLWVRSIDSTELRELQGTENVDHPFFSPDGRQIAFFADGRLKVADLAGGPPATIAEAVASGGDWHGDIILFGQPPNGIFSLPAGGGTPTPVTFSDTARGDLGHAWPSILPDGRRFLYFVSNPKPEHRGIYLGSLDGAPSVMVQASASMGAYAHPGVLLFARDGTLFAREFDPDSPQQQTPAVRVADGVGAHPTNGRLAVAVSDRVLAVRSGEPTELRRLEWHTAEGQALGPVGGLPSDAYQSVSLSPSGRDAVVTRVNSRGEGDIVLVDLQRGVAVPAAPDLADESMPLWTPDGAAIVYSSNRDGHFALYHRSMSVDGTERRIGSISGVRLAATDWTPDGKSLLVKASQSNESLLDIWLVPADGPEGEPRLLVAGPQNQQDAEVSPDGRWIAFASSESGRSEVFIQAYPPTGRRWLASTSGGSEPHWSPDGNQLYFLGPAWQIVRVAVRRVPGGLDLGNPILPQVSVPAILGLQENRYAVAPDGRLLTLKAVQNRRPAPVSLVLNWRALLPWDQHDR